jgi:hypothetical protein
MGFAKPRMPERRVEQLVINHQFFQILSRPEIIPSDAGAELWRNAAIYEGMILYYVDN